MPEFSTDKILIVDSDVNIAELLQVNLGSEGYGVDVTSSCSSAMELPLADFALVIADGMEQEPSGIDLVRACKNSPDTAHVLFILFSDYHTEHDVVDALDAGADDYMVKPISLREMVARVKAVMRRRVMRRQPVQEAAPAGMLRFEDLTLDVVRRSAAISGRDITLTRTELAILEMLMRNVGHYVSRLEIHRNVWPEEVAGANERKVDTNISRLRKKLGRMDRFLSSRSGLGYMLSND